MIREELSEQRLSKINSVVLFSIIILGMLSLLSFLFLDERLLSFINNHDLWGNSIAVKVINQFGKGGFLVWLLLILIFITGCSRPAVAALLALLLVWPVIWPTKIVTSRPRPRDVIEKDAEVENQNFLIRSWSFPSGDAASTFAVATALTPFVSVPLTMLFFLIAGAVGLARLLVFAHYLSDVFAGAAVGIFVGWLALRIIQKKIPPDFLQFRGHRIVAVAGAIIMLVSTWWYRGSGRSLIFLETGLFFIAAIYLFTLLGRWINGSKDLSS